MALAEPAVRAVNELRTVHFGPNGILATISLDFADSSGLEDIERTVTRLERQIKERWRRPASITTETPRLEMAETHERAFRNLICL